MAESKSYDREYKVQSVKLAKEIGQAKAAQEIGIPKNTLYSWVRASRLGALDLGAGTQTPGSAMTLNGHGRESCVSVFRQSQGWRCGNRANLGLKPFLTTCPGGRGGMRAACGVNAALAAGIR